MDGLISSHGERNHEKIIRKIIKECCYSLAKKLARKARMYVFNMCYTIWDW